MSGKHVATAEVLFALAQDKRQTLRLFAVFVFAVFLRRCCWCSFAFSFFRFFAVLFCIPLRA